MSRAQEIASQRESDPAHVAAVGSSGPAQRFTLGCEDRTGVPYGFSESSVAPDGAHPGKAPGGDFRKIPGSEGAVVEIRKRELGQARPGDGAYEGGRTSPER
ncbi:hypothetical protein Saso_73920 [Streptomyces asoensis]|uniref:Uncharacterized protein n=1 Tax=Streptomyces asoensis TaxID=249586 RepID=A0ABQ3SC84_9ACTN|nr:hypothetical protein GCM10010496_73250 [Streptomyces asoensis]GHI65742.1 hypothetical protein Saso_73920 [Streptomyces asoensis]